MLLRSELPKPGTVRTSKSSQAVVKGKDGKGRGWKESAHIISASANGSTFNMKRKCDVGTLVTLMIPLPVHLRCYDYDKESYRVWGLVQHCTPMTSEKKSTFNVGVAFIGKDCPESYQSDPQQHYRISGIGDGGMWQLVELKRPFKKRSDVRFWRHVELYLALIDTKDRTTAGERTFAENVSRTGAAVFTTMNVGIGDRVKFISEQYDFSGLAVVCNLQRGDDERTKLHLEFVETTFPVDALMTPEPSAKQI
jgi:hypothetical protein